MQTVQHISDNPPKHAVTLPTDKAKLQQDVDRKLRMYGVFKAFNEGKYPSNNQIDHTLAYALENSPIDESKLSEEGRELIDDFRSIIETARQIVKQKNADEIVQEFLYSTRKADSSKLNPKNAASAPVSQDAVRQDGQEAAENLKVLGKLLFTNSEVRKLLKDFGLIGRDIGADAATKLANKARPNDEQLNQIDDPAPKSQWVGPNGEIHGPNDHVPDTGLAARREQALETKEQLRAQANQVHSEVQGHVTEGQNRLQGAYNAAPGDSSRGPSGAQQDAVQGEGSQVLSEKADIASSKAQQLKDRIPQEHKDKAREYHGRTKRYLQDKIPEERRDRFIYRLKKVIIEQQEHSDYRDAVEFFLSLAETYQGHAQHIQGQINDHATTSISSDPHFTNSWQSLRTILERFANNRSMAPIFKATDDIYTDAKNDPELRTWFGQLDAYIRKVLLEPGYVMRDECDREGTRLRENGKGFFSERYRPHREAFSNAVEDFFKAYAADPLNVQFGQDWKRLLKDLVLDGDGNMTYKPHLWQDVRSVILPELLNSIGYFPIPRIEYTDNQLDLVIENLILDAPNLLPNVIELDVRNYFKLSAFSNIGNANHHTAIISFAQVQSDIKDVAFHVRKKTGFPKLTDSGIADVTIGGKGISGKIHLTTNVAGEVYKVKDVKIKIDSLKVKIREGKHSFLHAIIRTLSGNLIKNAIAKALSAAIRAGLEQGNQQLSDINERLNDAKGRDDVSRTDVLKDVFNDKKKKADSAQQAAEERNSQFRISATADQKIVNWESKNSIVAQQAEREKLVHAHDHRWKSEAFDWVSELQGKNVQSRVV